MRRMGRRWLWAALAVLMFAAPALAGKETRGVCSVCRVTKGEAEPEPFKAMRTHEGATYGFCSETCAKAFEADPAAYLPPAFPRPAPPFALETLARDAVSNESLKGKIVLMDFWATWCAPCRMSMPELQAIHEAFRDRGVVVLGVSIDEKADAKVKSFVASKRFTYPIAIDSGVAPAWDAFRVKAVPAAYLMDRKGRIVAQWLGAAADPRELEAKLEALLKQN